MPDSYEEATQEYSRAQITVGILLLNLALDCGVLLVATYQYFFEKQTSFAQLVPVFLLLIYIALLKDFSRCGNFFRTSMCMCIPLYISYSILGLMFGEMPNHLAMGIMVIPVYAYLMQGLRGGVAWSLVVIVTFPTLTYLATVYELPIEGIIPKGSVLIQVSQAMVTLLVILGGYAINSFYNDLLYRQLSKERTKLAIYAEQDGLTGLMNQRSFNKQLDMMLENDLTSDIALVVVDINDFKAVNDSYGHYAGDQYLKGVADLLKGALRGRDYVGRIGGDEFGVILFDIRNRESGEGVIKNILPRIDKSIEADGHQIPVSLSIGIAVNQGRNIDAKTLFREADGAMYQSKRENSSYAFAQ